MADDLRFPPTPGLARVSRAMAKSLDRQERRAAGADNRPRIYIRATGERTAAWRIGPHGRERPAASAGSCVDEALEHFKAAPAVIFWEGVFDAD